MMFEKDGLTFGTHFKAKSGPVPTCVSWNCVPKPRLHSFFLLKQYLQHEIGK